MVAQTQPEMRHHAQSGRQDETVGWRDYMQTVENCFLEIRGRGVHWSETDRARASAWYAMGLPAGATVRVLQARVQAWRFRHGQNARVPMNLGWYEPAVLEHAKHLRQLGDERLDPLIAQPVAPPAFTVTVLVAELAGLMAATQHQVLGHVYRKTFDWLDTALQGAAPDADPDAEVAMAAAPELDVLVGQCRTRMNKLLQSALDDEARGALAQFLADDPGAGGISKNARKMRQERLTERWLAGAFGHRVPTLTGWRDPREM